MALLPSTPYYNIDTLDKGARDPTNRVHPGIEWLWNIYCECTLITFIIIVITFPPLVFSGSIHDPAT